jgi:uncharacterized protein
MLRAIAITLLVLASPMYVFGASFDCSKATRQVEKIICSDKEISNLDE